ncbi:MAG: radical SAM family heme chaperone HemW [Anaerolineae bacterium]
MALGLYLHIPFCKAKCMYCDFASVAGRPEWFTPYTEAICAEIAGAPARFPAIPADQLPPQTVYIGGGTPSILPIPLLERILQALRWAFPLPAEAEISLEANPGTVDRGGLRRLRALGINRLSIGVQSFLDSELRLLGRIHTAEEARQAFRWAREAGFDNLNIDLIFGLPRQSLGDWMQSLEEALDLAPQHISLYALSVEEGTPLAEMIERGKLPALDDDQMADMYIYAGERLEQAGYLHYEISNWALPGWMCRHNLGTWRNEPYLGFGAAAHSHLGRRRWWNVRDPQTYMARIEAGLSPTDGEEALSEEMDMAETMILGLRLVQEGVEVERFRRRYGRTPAEAYPDVLTRLAAQGLIEISSERIRLTRHGRLLGNQVFAQFLPD